MKYRDVSWNLMINDEQANFDDNALEIIAEELQRGNTSGFFTTDCTDYNLCDNLKEHLESELGREIDFSVEDDDKGELEELFKIAKRNKDEKVIFLIREILENGFEN